MGLPTTKLPVLELFTSIQGEGRNLGVPYVFLRVGGCPLRCNFCDTEYSWHVKPDQIVDVSKIIEDMVNMAGRQGIEWISITGGEPMIYPEQLKDIMTVLYKEGFKVHIETSGRYWDATVHGMSHIWSADVKTPCTGEHRQEDMHWLGKMRKEDQVKCLISDEADLDYALAANRILDGKCPMVLQPFNEEIDSSQDKYIGRSVYMVKSYKWLVESVLKDVEEWKNIIIAPQVHVLLWGNKANR